MNSNESEQLQRMTAGLLEGADSLTAAANRLAQDRALGRAHELVEMAAAFLQGAEILRRAMAKTEGDPHAPK